MFARRRSLRNKSDESSIERLKEIENKLSEMCASDNLAIINEAFDGMTCEGGGVNASKLRNLKKKLQGIVHEPPHCYDGQ